MPLSGYAFSALREGELPCTGLGRRSGPDPARRAVAEQPGSNRSSGSSMKSLRAELASDWAHGARPYPSPQSDGVCRGSGGQPLDRLLGRALEVPQFLRIAIPLAAALRRVHERNLIHRTSSPRMSWWMWREAGPG